MNKIILIVLSMFSGFVAFSQDEPDQWTLFSEVTATWCPKCGTWGWDMFSQSLDEMQGENVFLWKLHYSGDLKNPTADTLARNLKFFAQPQFFINDDNIGVTSGNVDDKVKELDETVDLLNNTFGAFAGVQVDLDFDGVMLDVTASTNFISEINGNYHLGVYLVEDNVIANQAGLSSNANHRFVVRESLNENTFGPLFADGIATEGLEFSQEYTIDLELEDDDDPEDFYVVAIVWNYLESEDQYRVLNLGVSQVEALTSASNDLLSEESFKIYSSNNNIRILPENKETYSVRVYNSIGQELHAITTKGDENIQINNTTENICIVKVEQNGKSISKKIFLK